MSLNNSFINQTIICNEKKEINLDALNLLAFGELTQLCSCVYKNENKHHHFTYDTKELIPFNQLQAGLTFENVIDVLSSAADMIQALKENDLILDNVKNSKEYIFKSDSDYKFIYIPIMQKAHISIRDYVLKLLSVIHHKDARLVKFAKELRKIKDNDKTLEHLLYFISSYNSQSNYSEDATSLLSQEGNTTLLSDEGETSLLSMNAGDREADTSLLSDEGDTTVLSQAGFADNYGDENSDMSSDKVTEYFHDESGEYETTVLTSQPVFQNVPASRGIESQYSLYLIRNLNGERVTVDMTPFTIGKDSVNMDYVLNNDSVSRHHATIVYEDGDYFITDNNSTNGTTIEGVRLQSGEKGEIGNGYIISLGNESFQTHIERR